MEAMELMLKIVGFLCENFGPGVDKGKEAYMGTGGVDPPPDPLRGGGVEF